MALLRQQAVVAAAKNKQVCSFVTTTLMKKFLADADTLREVVKSASQQLVEATIRCTDLEAHVAETERLRIRVMELEKKNSETSLIQARFAQMEQELIRLRNEKLTF